MMSSKPGDMCSQMEVLRMLRCNQAGLIPLLKSKKFGAAIHPDDTSFEPLLQHESYYLFRVLPVALADRLLRPVLPAILGKQRSNGLWKNKDAERITYDILSALRHIGLWDPEPPARLLTYDPLTGLSGRFGLYALLIKDMFHAATPEDVRAKELLIHTLLSSQNPSGSWDDTVVGTVARVEDLLSLGVPAEHPNLQKAIGFLFSQYHEELEGLHTGGPYGLVSHGVFTTDDRHAEFLSAQRNKPEWIPREVCFRTMSILPNSVCVMLLLSLGMEEDTRVEAALDNLHTLYNRFGGFCATNIKKPFLS